jgi:hypothetical protein
MGSRLLMCAAFVSAVIFMVSFGIGGALHDPDIVAVGFCALLLATCASGLGLMWFAVFEME